MNVRLINIFFGVDLPKIKFVKFKKRKLVKLYYISQPLQNNAINNIMN